LPKKQNFVLLKLAIALSACTPAARNVDPPPYRVEGDLVVFADGRRPAGLSLEPVRLAGSDHLTVTGRLVWDEDTTVRVFPPVSGRVVSIRADVGVRVGAGQTLALLASPDFGQAQSDAARTAADLSAADHTLERIRPLFERGAAPRKDLDQAEADRERARAEAARTRARLTLWGGPGAVPGTVDQFFGLKSPVAGLVVERALNPGQEVRSDATTPLFVVSDPRTLWILLDVTEGDLPSVASGAALRVHSAAWPGRAFPGRLEVVGASLDPTTRKVRARGRVENADGLLKGEMYVTVDLLQTAAASRMVLPAYAVIRDHQTFVFVEEAPGRYRRMPVSLGAEREGVVTVLSGVQESSWLVTEGRLLLEAAWAEGRHS
jgi:cobalt-zinc-cadmium efflux system membrane fusion protein